GIASAFHGYVDPPELPSFPTRRSSDLRASPSSRIVISEPIHSQVLSCVPENPLDDATARIAWPSETPAVALISRSAPAIMPYWPDRKSTRLNSSHVKISYAVFCLKKKT